MANILKSFEHRLGLPSIDRVLDTIGGKNGEKINTLLRRLEKLSKDQESIRLALTLLNKVDEMNANGSLDKLLELVKDLNALTKSKQTQKLLDRLDTLDKLMDTFLKEN